MIKTFDSTLIVSKGCPASRPATPAAMARAAVGVGESEIENCQIKTYQASLDLYLTSKPSCHEFLNKMVRALAHRTLQAASLASTLAIIGRMELGPSFGLAWLVRIGT